MYAQTGASLADIQERLGHSTVQAAMRYQHSTETSGREYTAKLSKMANTL